MPKKKHKILVVGLPKTGTSTLTVMLRMLGYQVTGPEIHFRFGDISFLEECFERYDAFQDYPWCFEWERFKADGRVLFIELKRDPEAWWKSFYDSYGKKGKKYLSQPYFKLDKEQEAKALFLDYFKAYYRHFESFKKTFQKNVLSIDLETFGWKELCEFLDEPIPKTVFGKEVKKPHINKINHKYVRSYRYKLFKRLNKYLISFFGIKRWQQLTLFLRKNGFEF